MYLFLKLETNLYFNREDFNGYKGDYDFNKGFANIC